MSHLLNEIIIFVCVCYHTIVLPIDTTCQKALFVIECEHHLLIILSSLLLQYVRNMSGSENLCRLFQRGSGGSTFKLVVIVRVTFLDITKSIPINISNSYMGCRQTSSMTTSMPCELLRIAADNCVKMRWWLRFGR